MSNATGVVVIILSAASIVAGLVVGVQWSVTGRPNWTRKYWWHSLKIRREYERKVGARALQIMTDNPELDYKCEDYPRYKALCGGRCAWSQAAEQVQKENDAINAVIRATLGGPR